jgi:hypothetical protein
MTVFGVITRFLLWGCSVSAVFGTAGILHTVIGTNYSMTCSHINVQRWHCLPVQTCCALLKYMLGCTVLTCFT